MKLEITEETMSVRTQGGAGTRVVPPPPTRRKSEVTYEFRQTQQVEYKRLVSITVLNS